MIKLVTKKDKVAHALREAIVSGRIKPGSKLSIAHLASEHNVSEIPVREALQVLVQESYLIAEPYIGYTVSTVSEEDVRKVFEMRIALETLAAQLAADRITDDGISKLWNMFDISKDYLTSLDYSGYWQFNHEFHDCIYQFSANEKLSGMIEDLERYSNRYPQYFISQEQLHLSLSDHKRIICALAQRNRTLVGSLIHAHTIDSYNTVLSRVRDSLSTQAMNSSDLGA